MSDIHFGVDWGERHARVVALEKTGHEYRLAGRIEIRDVTPDEAPARLAAALRAEKLRPRRALAGISGAGVLMRYLRLPRLDEEKLGRLMQMEIDEFTSRSEGKFSYDYGILNVPTREFDRFLMLVAMAKDEDLQRTFDRLKAAGVPPVGSVPAPLGLFNAYVKFGELDAKGVVALVDLAPNAIHFVLAKESTLYFARSLSGGLNLFVDPVAESEHADAAGALARIEADGDITPGADADHDLSVHLLGAAGQVLNMVESNIKFARAQLGLSNLEVAKVFLSGEAHRIRGLDRYLMKSLSRTVVPFVPAGDLEGQDLAGYEVALGLAQMSADESAYRLTLLPEKEKRRQAFLQETLYQYLAAAAMVLFLIASFVIRSGRAGEFEEQAAALAAKRNRGVTDQKRIESAEKEIDAARRKFDLLAVRIRPGAEFRRLFDLLQEHTPAHVFVTRIEYVPGRGATGETRFKVEGFVEEYLSDMQSVAVAFAARIADRPELARCDLMDTKLVEETGVLVFTLEIVMAQEPPAGESREGVE